MSRPRIGPDGGVGACCNFASRALYGDCRYCGTKREASHHHQLVLGRDQGGLRNFLDGKPVPCGTYLELLLHDGHWSWVRYEARLIEPVEITLYLPLPSLSIPIPYHEDMRFRWPS